MNRYLQPTDKVTILAEWQRLQDQPRPAGDLAGKGWPDPEIIPLCDELNKLFGVCTLQSCSGHGGGGGGLWLWLDEPTSRMFDLWGHVLANMQGIEVVSRKYTAWGQEITAIDFDSRFDKALKSVLLFFRALAATSCNRQPPLLTDIRCRARPMSASSG